MERDPTQSQILENYINQCEEQKQEASAIKKRYLKENILDRYPTQEHLIDKFLDFFLQYLKKQKGVDTEEHDLGILTLPELKDLVDQFHLLYPPGQQNDISRAAQNTTFTTELKIQELKNIPQEKFDAKKIYYANGSWDYELEGYEQCERVKDYFDIKDYNQNIVLFEKVQIKKTGGFFGIGGKSELWIELRTNFFKESVSRRAEDFIDLRNILRRICPYVFIYPLQVSQKQLQRVSDENIRSLVSEQCRRFINYVSKSQIFLQTLYTHRFFKQSNYQSFLTHKVSYPKIMIDKIRSIKNADGCVPIQISDRNELLKKDYVKKGQGLQQIWIKWESANSLIIAKLKQAQTLIQRQRRELQKALLDYANVNPLLRCETYQKVSQMFINYGEIFRNSEETLESYSFFFQSVNHQVAKQAKKMWGFFSQYARGITEIDRDYTIRRKVFLQRELKQAQIDRQKPDLKANEPQIDPINKTIFSQLGIPNNCIRQAAWVERFSKWQAFLNKQFTKSFQLLLSNDVNALNKILKQNLQSKHQIRRKEQILLKNIQLIKVL